MQAALSRLGGRMRNMVGRAVLGMVNDAAALQSVQVQILADQVRDNAEHFQHYGFTSVPFPGAEGIALAVGGSSGHTVVINIDDRRYRIKLESGEVALYDDQGQYVKLGRDGQVAVKASTKLTLEAPEVDVQADVFKVQATTVSIVSSTLTHNGVNTGGDHQHGGIVRGNQLSDPPGG